jgi:hypothetical protein
LLFAQSEQIRRRRDASLLTRSPIKVRSTTKISPGVIRIHRSVAPRFAAM